VEGEAFGFTESHQVAVDVSDLGGGEAVSRTLKDNGIIVNMNLLPFEPLDHVTNPAGLRLGVQEIILDGKVEENQKINIFVMVNNTGDADAYNVTVNFFIDGKMAGSKPISIIAMRANRTASWDWVPTAGKHNITVTVSGDGAGP
jgi:subtilase family serine protease